MCRRLLDAGFPLTAFDLSPDALAVAVTGRSAGCDFGGRVRTGRRRPAHLAARPDHVASVMRDGGALQALRPGSVWVDLTTNRKELVAELAADAPTGVSVLDSPVTGAVDGARNGRLTLFVGGDEATVDRMEPILSHLGLVIRCGGLGTGNVVKLVTNQLWFIAAAAIGEGSRSVSATVSSSARCGTPSRKTSATASLLDTTHRRSSPVTTTRRSASICAERISASSTSWPARCTPSCP